MRVIRESKQFPETEITCPHCKAELAYDTRDILTHYEEWYFDYYIVCPVCRKRIVFHRIYDVC